MKKKILVINLGWEQEPLLDRLVDYNVEIYGIHYNKDYYKAPIYKDIFITDLRNIETILNYAKQVQPDAVISDQCDYSYFAQAIVAESLDLSGPRIKEAQISTNKYLQRIKAKEQGVLVPDFTLCTHIDDVCSFADKFGYPIITKPIDNRGSFGVNKINNELDIKEAYEDALVNSHSRLVIAEKFIEGTHITVDGYVFKEHGVKTLAIAEKTLTKGKRQVAIDIKYPASFDEIFYNEIVNINENINTFLGLKFGMIHAEYMITEKNEIYLIETANRGGGVYTSEIIVPNVSNVDIVNQYICDCLGIAKDYYKPVEKNPVFLTFFNLEVGKVKEIIGVEKFLENKNILKFQLKIKKGDLIEKVTTDANRHGFIISKNERINISEFRGVVYED